MSNQASHADAMIEKILGVSPWDYGDVRYSVNGLIRLDYAPVWFIAGLILA